MPPSSCAPRWKPTASTSSSSTVPPPTATAVRTCRTRSDDWATTRPTTPGDPPGDSSPTTRRPDKVAPASAPGRAGPPPRPIRALGRDPATRARCWMGAGGRGALEGYVSVLLGGEGVALGAEHAEGLGDVAAGV